MTAACLAAVLARRRDRSSHRPTTSSLAAAQRRGQTATKEGRRRRHARRVGRRRGRARCVRCSRPPPAITVPGPERQRQSVAALADADSAHATKYGYRPLRDAPAVGERGGTGADQGYASSRSPAPRLPRYVSPASSSVRVKATATRSSVRQPGGLDQHRVASATACAMTVRVFRISTMPTALKSCKGPSRDLWTWRRGRHRQPRDEGSRLQDVSEATVEYGSFNHSARLSTSNQKLSSTAASASPACSRTAAAAATMSS